MYLIFIFQLFLFKEEKIHLMNMLYLKIIYVVNVSIILFVFLVSKNIFADQTATIIADKIVANNESDIINAEGNVLILNHDGTKIKANEIIYDRGYNVKYGKM